MSDGVARRDAWRPQGWAWLIPMVALGAGLAASCGGGESGVGVDGRAQTTIVVFAAASLTDVFGDIEVAFEDANPAVDVVVSPAGSSTLREQILDGAPADVFASADEANMAPVVAAGEAATPVIFAHNTLALAVPAGNPGGVTGLADLADPELLVGVCARGVPCGDFAREVLAAAGVEPSVDTDEPDVRSLLTKLTADELDAGIVYATDVAAADGLVEAIAIPEEINVDAAYPIAALTQAANPEGAAAFVAFVTSAQGREVVARWGFTAP